MHRGNLSHLVCLFKTGSPEETHEGSKLWWIDPQTAGRHLRYSDGTWQNSSHSHGSSAVVSTPAHITQHLFFNVKTNTYQKFSTSTKDHSLTHFAQFWCRHETAEVEEFYFGHWSLNWQCRHIGRARLSINTWNQIWENSVSFSYSKRSMSCKVDQTHLPVDLKWSWRHVWVDSGAFEWNSTGQRSVSDRRMFLCTLTQSQFYTCGINVWI